MGLMETIKKITESNLFKKEEKVTVSNYPPFEKDTRCPNNCPVRETTKAGYQLGRCWLYLENGRCSTHGIIHWKK